MNPLNIILFSKHRMHWESFQFPKSDPLCLKMKSDEEIPQEAWFEFQWFGSRQPIHHAGPIFRNCYKEIGKPIGSGKKGLNELIIVRDGLALDLRRCLV